MKTISLLFAMLTAAVSNVARAESVRCPSLAGVFKCTGIEGIETLGIAVDWVDWIDNVPAYVLTLNGDTGHPRVLLADGKRRLSDAVSIHSIAYYYSTVTRCEPSTLVVEYGVQSGAYVPELPQTIATTLKLGQEGSYGEKLAVTRIVEDRSPGATEDQRVSDGKMPRAKVTRTKGRCTREP